MARATRSAAKAAAHGTTSEPTQLSSPPATPKRSTKSRAISAKSAQRAGIKQEPPSTPANSGKKRSRRSIKQEDGDVNELPHNLGTTLPSPGADAEYDENEKPRKRTKKSPSKSAEEQAEIKTEGSPGPTPSKRTPKKANYGLTPGVSPFPDYMRPTADECEEVVRLLEKQHGKAIVPKAIPPPSMDVAGCGEVPSVLDALIRTRLSANTTNKNSSTAFRGLATRFGTLKEGIGAGSVDWDAVRRAPNIEVFKAIEKGGLAKIKSKDIQEILQMVYEENQERKAALVNPSDDPAGVENEPEEEKKDEINKAKKNIISLDHLHLLSTNDAITKMLSYPGIGPKTASCVALFCLQRPSFAVDTHVFRLCQYLGWVPKSIKKGQPKVDRNTTYSHCDVRIPDEYKYPLHQLLIKHGKTCPRCRAATGQSSADWDAGCPIEHLVKRHGAKKGGTSIVARKKAKNAAMDDEAEVDEGMEVDEAAEEGDSSDD